MKIERKYILREYMVIIAVIGKRYYQYKAKDQEQFDEFAAILRQSETLDELRKGLAYTIDGVPAYIRKRAGKHSITTFAKAKKIYDACEFLDGGGYMTLAESIMIGYELGREYERKASRMLRALNGAKIGKKPEVKANRSTREKLIDTFSLNY